MKRITLTRKGFREWLEGKRPKEKVGTSAMSTCCPIAVYLKAHGAKNPYVYCAVFYLNGPYSERHKTPEWAINAIRGFDRRKPWGRKAITARQALAVLAVLDEKEAGA